MKSAPIAGTEAKNTTKDAPMSYPNVTMRLVQADHLYVWKLFH